jgi:hypothetical protein
VPFFNARLFFSDTEAAGHAFRKTTAEPPDCPSHSLIYFCQFPMRYTLRLLLNNPSFTAVAVVSVALC